MTSAWKARFQGRASRRLAHPVVCFTPYLPLGAWHRAMPKRLAGLRGPVSRRSGNLQGLGRWPTRLPVRSPRDCRSARRCGSRCGRIGLDRRFSFAWRCRSSAALGADLCGPLLSFPRILVNKARANALPGTMRGASGTRFPRRGESSRSDSRAPPVPPRMISRGPRTGRFSTPAKPLKLFLRDVEQVRSRSVVMPAALHLRLRRRAPPSGGMRHAREIR